jgi:hypothetical protein
VQHENAEGRALGPALWSTSRPPRALEPYRLCLNNARPYVEKKNSVIRRDVPRKNLGKRPERAREKGATVARRPYCIVRVGC